MSGPLTISILYVSFCKIVDANISLFLPWMSVNMSIRNHSIPVNQTLRDDIFEHRFCRPRKADAMTFIVLRRSDKLNYGYECVGRNSGHNMPPAVQLKEDAPRHTELSFPAGQGSAEIDVDVPDAVREECCNCKVLVSSK